MGESLSCVSQIVLEKIETQGWPFGCNGMIHFVGTRIHLQWFIRWCSAHQWMPRLDNFNITGFSTVHHLLVGVVIPHWIIISISIIIVVVIIMNDFFDKWILESERFQCFFFFF
mmetsp:Transcript_98530/g.283162  ORF Transcript_98530/g.283162 Transcript_98530/m.283162 type:complete len:114 (+) Transcript_98530:413-754(+)